MDIGQIFIARYNVLKINQKKYTSLSDLCGRLDKIIAKCSQQPKETFINLAEISSYPITKFDEALRNSEWFTQFHYGCLFFAMLNGSFIEKQWKLYFTPKMNFSQNDWKKRTMLQTVKGVTHEYKAIVLWHILTGYNVVPGKRDEISKEIKDMLQQNNIEEMYRIAREIRDNLYKSEELFGIRYENGKTKDFAYEQWSFRGLKAQSLSDTTDKNLLDKKLKYLERCPRYSLFCDRHNHWTVFLGCKDTYMVFYDSMKYNGLQVLHKNLVAERTISVLKKSEDKKMSKNFSKEGEVSNEEELTRGVLDEIELTKEEEEMYEKIFSEDANKPAKIKIGNEWVEVTTAEEYDREAEEREREWKEFHEEYMREKAGGKIKEDFSEAKNFSEEEKQDLLEWKKKNSI